MQRDHAPLRILSVTLPVVLAACVLGAEGIEAPASPPIPAEALRDPRTAPPFLDDFEHGLANWRLVGAHALRSVETEPGNRALELEGDGYALALIEGSEDWDRVALTGRFTFPELDSSYLGFVWGYRETETRTDFGNIYVKANGNYLRVNPFRDGNASRLLYEELKTPLTGEDALQAGQWMPFRLEVIDGEAHLYLGTSATPKVTFADYEHARGALGFHPRIVGGRAWVDDVRVESIPEFSYDGPPIPERAYDPTDVLYSWEALGPFDRPRDDWALGRGAPPAEEAAWQPFATDSRGAVVTGRLVEYRGPRPVAYFRTRVHCPVGGPAVLHLSTTDELALWIDGRFQGFVYRNGYLEGPGTWNAWHDFLRNPEHGGSTVALELAPGTTEIVLRARAGQFAAGGFFAGLVR